MVLLLAIAVDVANYSDDSREFGYGTYGNDDFSSFMGIAIIALPSGIITAGYIFHLLRM